MSLRLHHAANVALGLAICGLVAMLMAQTPERVSEMRLPNLMPTSLSGVPAGDAAEDLRWTDLGARDPFQTLIPMPPPFVPPPVPATPPSLSRMCESLEIMCLFGDEAEVLNRRTRERVTVTVGESLSLVSDVDGRTPLPVQIEAIDDVEFTLTLSLDLEDGSPQRSTLSVFPTESSEVGS